MSLKGYTPENEATFKDRGDENGGGQSLWLYRTRSKAIEVYASYHHGEEQVNICPVYINRVSDEQADGFIECMDFFVDDGDERPDLQIVRPREIAAQFYGVDDPAKMIPVKITFGEAKTIKCPTFSVFCVRLDCARVFKKEKDADRFAKKLERFLIANGFSPKEADSAVVINEESE